MRTTTQCGICSKTLLSGDCVYGACHECAKKTIHNRMRERHKCTNRKADPGDLKILYDFLKAMGNQR